MNITGNFEGGNPQDPKSIALMDGDTFSIHPFSEDGDLVYKFRLDVKVLSEGKTRQRIKLRIHWKDEQYNMYRRRIFAMTASLPLLYWINTDPEKRTFGVYKALNCTKCALNCCPLSLKRMSLYR